MPDKMCNANCVFFYRNISRINRFQNTNARYLNLFDTETFWMPDSLFIK